MVKMTRKNVVLSLLAVGVPILFFFQNCSQNGTAATSKVALFQSTTTSESLIIVAPTSNQISDINITPPDQSEDDNKSSDKGSIGSCAQLAVSDILLKIVSISSHHENPNEMSFEIVDADKSVSLEKLTLKIKAIKTEQIKNIVLILNTQGNKILTADNVVIDLKTPVNEQSIVRVSLIKEYTVTEGYTYNLVLKVNPNELIASTNKNNCLFKPLIQAADLASIQ